MDAFYKDPGFVHNSVGAIIEDKKGNIWTAGNIGICKYDGTSFTQYTRREGLSSDFVNSYH